MNAKIAKVEYDAGNITAEQYMAILEGENTNLQAKAHKIGELRFKVTEARAPGTKDAADKGTKGGALSVYGLGKFPVTLYKSQWVRLFSAASLIVAFMKENDDKLSEKETAETKAAA